LGRSAMGAKTPTLWIRVLVKKLTRFQLTKKFPAFYGSRRFISAFRRARHAASLEPETDLVLPIEYAPGRAPQLAWTL